VLRFCAWKGSECAHGYKVFAYILQIIREADVGWEAVARSLAEIEGIAVMQHLIYLQ
jgi:hypothetical protein